MKMTKEDYNMILGKFLVNQDKVVSHYNHIKSTGNYNVLEVRVAWDCLRAFLGTNWICDQYDKGLNDDHIRTACVKALKTVLGD
jgi:hypothetical protein